MKDKSIAALAAMFLAMTSAGGAAHAASKKSIDHGKYLVNIGGCNDCHTPGYGANDGAAPRDQLLVGSGLVWHGPWGTTYPINLRLFVQGMTVQQWIKVVRSTKARPPMPWWAFRYMSDHDLASIYDYIHSLGPAGKPAPAYLPPGQTPPPPYMEMVLPPAPATSAPSDH